VVETPRQPLLATLFSVPAPAQAQALQNLDPGCLPAHLQLEQLQDVRPRHVRKLVVRVQGLTQALQGAERAQHEGERRREAEGLVDGDREQVLADRLRARLAGATSTKSKHQHFYRN